MASPYEKLFLLEVLVDSLYISYSSISLDAATKSNLRETCVMFQFLNYPALVVCEEDFASAQPKPKDTQLNFSSGKSCIFSMDSTLIPSLPYKFDVNVSVIRKLEQPPSKVVLGSATISLGDSFAALMHASVDEPDLPLQKTITGTFDLADRYCKKVGDINVFLRLSCFGQLIVTQFQVGANQDAFMFKGTEPKKAVELPGDISKAPKIEASSDYNYMKPQAAGVAEDGTGRGDRDQGRFRDGAGYEGMCNLGPCDCELPSQPPQEPEGNYKEIVAEIRGHSLHIRVPMKPKKDKSDKRRGGTEEPLCKYAPPLNLCDCDFPVPPEAIPRCD